MTVKTISKTISKDGDNITLNPDMAVFLKEAGFSKNSIVDRITHNLNRAGIDTVEQLYKMTSRDFVNIEGITTRVAKKIYSHASLLRRNGNPLLMSAKHLREYETRYRYLAFPSNSLNRMFTYANGQVGIRSGVLLELYGLASVGKTQLCMTIAAMCMRKKEIGGWDKSVLFIDSEGSFDLTRMMYMARYWRVSEKEFLDKMIVSKAHNFDDVDEAIDSVAKIIDSHNIGMIIIDSIMDPLKSQYPLGGEDRSNLQPRQQHLKQVTDALKSIAQRYNIIAIYTNHVRANFSDDGPATIAQGGNVLAHASDIRIELRHDIQEKDSIFVRCMAKIVDCGFLPANTGYYSLGSMGAIDPEDEQLVLEHEMKIRAKGYVCVDSFGKMIEPMSADHARQQVLLEARKNSLYQRG